MIARNEEVFFSHQATPKARNSSHDKVGFCRHGIAFSNSVSVSECKAQIICDGESPLKIKPTQIFRKKNHNEDRVNDF